MSKESLKRAGDVIIGDIILESQNGVSLNISPQVTSIEITENIFEPFTSGKITVLDGQNISNLFPLVGGEYVTISFRTPSFDEKSAYVKSFFVYAVSDKIKTAERTSMYQFKLISVDAVKDRTVRLSRTYRGQPHEVIQEIITISGLLTSNQLVFEPAVNDLVFISNMWKPSKCIDYVCRHAYNSEGAPTFMFFEQKNSYVFVTLDYLCAQPTTQHFFDNNWSKQAATDNANSTTAMEVGKEYQTIRRADYTTGYSHFARADQGFYGCETIGIDALTQQYVHVTNQRKFADGVHLNKYDPLPVNRPATTSVFINYVPFVTQNFEGQNQGITDTDFAYRGIRQQAFARLASTHINIQVWGRTDYTVGMVVNLSVPKEQQITATDDPEDKLLSGRYLITSLKHIVNGGEHVCNMQLMKDSYIVDINHCATADKPSQNTGPETIVKEGTGETKQQTSPAQQEDVQGGD